MTWLAHRILETLADAEVTLDVAELAAGLERDPKSIGMACIVLHRRGLIDRPVYGSYCIAPAGRALLDAGGAVRSGPVHGRRAKVQSRTLRHRLWLALGQRRKGTLPELLALTAVGDERDAERNARRYLRLLERAGYLVRLPGHAAGLTSTSNGYVKWLVVRWTGPRAPVSQGDHAALYDPNLGQTVPVEARP